MSTAHSQAPAPPVSAAIAGADDPPAAGAVRLPGGPKTPKLLNGFFFLAAQHRSLRRLHRRYGDAYTVELPVIGRTVVVSRPDLMKAVYTADPTVLHGGENPLGKLLGPGSLFSMDEDAHLQERRTLLPPFHGDRMRSYEPLIEEETLRGLKLWPDDEDFATIRTFQSITLRVILRAVFGAEGAELADLEELLPGMTAFGQRLVTMPILRRDFGRWSPGRRFAAMRRRYDEIVGRLIDKHLEAAGREERIDILALMIEGADGDIDRPALADELLTLLVAGHETTASSLAWSVERLRRHPRILKRLEREVEDGGSTLRTATILEVLRTRPVITATGRVAMKPFQLGEWRLPPGMRVVTQAATLHRDERFHRDAHSFEPDRYVGTKPDTYAWVPFGGGVRRCIGAAFAQLEMDVVIRTMLEHFELLPTSARGERQRFRGVAFAPARGGRAVVRRRRRPLGEAGGRPLGEAAGDRSLLLRGDHAGARCPVEHGSGA